MSTLVVDRMTAVSPMELQARARGLQGGVAHRGLADALRVSPLPEGDWFVRRLDVSVLLDTTRSDPSIETAWAGAVIAALQGALRAGSADVVHYRHRLDGLVDLVASLASGDGDRAWAWHQAGLVVDLSVSPLIDPATTVVSVLGRSPESAVAVLVQSLARVGLARLHRLLGAGGWSAVARLAATAVGASINLEPAADVDPLRPLIAGALSSSALSSSALSSSELSSPAVPATVAAERLTDRVATALATSRLAEAFRNGGIRADERVSAAWSVLALAETDPAVLKQGDAASVVDLAARLLAGRPGVGGPGAGAYEHRTQDRPAGAVGTARSPDEPGMAPSSWPTVWGGLLFLLATATEAGVPDRLTDERVLTERPLSWCLHEVATRLVPAGADDPAVLVLAGLPVDGEAPLRARLPMAEEDARLDQVARVWAEVTAARLGRERDVDVFDVVREITLRRGEIAWEPGWVDVHLRLDDVDVDVRCAGLDLDPGWVPWLGTVVRFVHD